MEPSKEDVDALVREKYGNDREAAGLADDIARLAGGEPLAYVIGHIPFMGLSLDLFSHPLIPRPETEWWTELLINHLNEISLKKEKTLFSTTVVNKVSYEEKQETKDTPREIRVLDLCAGSGAIGLAVLKHCPNTHISFGERMEEHDAVIRKNIKDNDLDAARADIRIGDLCAPFVGERFDLIASNPPYIPTKRTLEASVVAFEPPEALFAGADGLNIIRRICSDASLFLNPGGEMWMECDISNIEQASALAIEGGASYTKIRTDQYGRPRLLVAYY